MIGLVFWAVVSIAGWVGASFDIRAERISGQQRSCCAGCGYELVGLPPGACCPECGRTDPAAAFTWRMNWRWNRAMLAGLLILCPVVGVLLCPVMWTLLYVGTGSSVATGWKLSFYAGIAGDRILDILSAIASIFVWMYLLLLLGIGRVHAVLLVGIAAGLCGAACASMPVLVYREWSNGELYWDGAMLWLTDGWKRAVTALLVFGVVAAALFMGGVLTRLRLGGSTPS